MVAIIWGGDNGSFFVPFGVLTFWRPFARFLFYRKQTAMHFCLDVVTVCRWEQNFQKEGTQGLMKKQMTKSTEKRQKKQEQAELQQKNKRLSEENYRLRMENDYLKKLNALIQKREKPE